MTVSLTRTENIQGKLEYLAVTDIKSKKNKTKQKQIYAHTHKTIKSEKARSNQSIVK